jgi:hypothetical protein
MRRRARGRPFAPAGLIAREFIHTLPYAGSEDWSLALLSLPEFAGHAGSTPSSGCRNRCSLVVAAYAEAAEVLKADQLRLAIA